MNQVSSKKNSAIFLFTSIILLVFAPICSFGYNYSLSKVVTYSNIGVLVDKQLNTFAFNAKGFKKLSKDGTLLHNYISNETGDILSMDVDPSGRVIILFDVGTIVIWNNTYAEIGRFSVLNLEITEAIHVTFSSDGGFWVYDGVEDILKRFDITGKVKFRGKEIKLPSGQNLDPTHIQESAGKVYVTDPNLGIFVFDSYGNLVKEHGLQGIYRFQVNNDILVYASEAKVYSMNLTTYKKIEITGFITDLLPTQACFAGSNLVLADERKIVFFKNE